ncbi:MAG TPA: glycosyl hydrolase [Candidatus Saccharimonadales bacterium]|nr:glycosyl hydrolase [Candidatus Saccharimonadales bacterium]
MTIPKRTKLTRKGFGHIELLFFILLIAALSGVGYYVYNNLKTNSYKAEAASWDNLGTAKVSYSPAQSVTVEACSEAVSGGRYEVKMLAASSTSQPYNGGIHGAGRLYVTTPLSGGNGLTREAIGSSSDWWGHYFQEFDLLTTKPGIDPSNITFTYILTGQSSNAPTAVFNGSAASVGGCNGSAARNAENANISNPNQGLFAPQNGKVYLGVSTEESSANLNVFDNAAGISQPAILNDYLEPGASPFTNRVDNILNFGNGIKLTSIAGKPFTASITPMISWDLPFDYSANVSGSDAGTCNPNINTNGDKSTTAQLLLSTESATSVSIKNAINQDKAQINDVIAAVKKFGAPVFIRLDWEFNGTWYPNYGHCGGETSADYIASWQYVVNQFRAAGLTNKVAFVWAPNDDGTSDPQWYPGNGYVDWMAIDSYPTVGNVNGELVGLNAVAQFASQNNKPMALAEWATPTNTASLVNDYFHWQQSYPDTVKANLWFNFKTPYLLQDYPAVQQAYQSFVQGPHGYLTSPIE